jgi:hypothetical protein
MKAYTKKPGSEDRFLHAAGVDCIRDESDRTIVVAESGWRPADAPSRLSGHDASARAARFIALNKCQLIAYGGNSAEVEKTADPDQGRHQIWNFTVANFVATL